MKLYILEFRQGEYSDYTETLMGIYSSPEKRKEALEQYSKSAYFKKCIESSCLQGRFNEYEVELDQNLFSQNG